MFVQLMEYQTSKPDEVQRLHDEWKQATGETGSARRMLVTKHHGEADRFCELVFFESYDDAMENSKLPETQEFAKRFRDAVDGEVTYFDLDVLREEDL